MYCVMEGLADQIIERVGEHHFFARIPAPPHTVLASRY